MTIYEKAILSLFRFFNQGNVAAKVKVKILPLTLIDIIHCSIVCYWLVSLKGNNGKNILDEEDSVCNHHQGDQMEVNIKNVMVMVSV